MFFTGENEIEMKKISEIDKKDKKKKKKTYPQNWAAYNKAQKKEKLIFLELLHDLVSQIPRPIHNGKGRPPVFIGDMIYCCGVKLYNGMSSRRNESDIIIAYERGYIDKVPHSNTVLNYLNKPELKNYLIQLIRITALPLKNYEKTFTVDATGFSTSLFGRWLNIRKPSKLEMMDVRKYLKCHIMSGTRTNIITHVEVTDYTVHDTLMFPELVNKTAELFKMEEVCADKGYLSRKNFDIVAKYNAIPYILFKNNSIGRSGRVPMWNTMYHLFITNQEEFMKHYHQRSNVESIFSAIKRKFGDYLRSKSKIGCENEILLKCLIHNICCLIQEMFTLGIKVDFKDGAAQISWAES